MELTIEKLVYGGDGLARLKGGEPRAKAIFIPYVLPGEKVEADIAAQHAGFARAQLKQILEPSAMRTTPPCPYFGECGGCHYQHTSYEEQLRLKTEILRETLRRTGKLDLAVEIQTHSSPPLEYRNRTKFHLLAKPAFAIGYFRHGSHELLAVRECPISARPINRALEVIWSLGASGQVPEEISEIELFAASDDRLMVELYLRSGPTKRDALIRFANGMAAALPEIHGIASFTQADPQSCPQGEAKADLLAGENTVKYDIGGESYRVSAGAFFQTNRFLASQMVRLAVAERQGRMALDLYAGVGLFALPLARRFERVIAVESSRVSVDDLRANAPANLKVSSQSVEAYLTSVAGTLKPDLILVDPPRAGLGSTVVTHVSHLGSREMVYVSCDPATLARDLKQLTAAGWIIVEMHLIDLFPQTFHIETCAVLRRD